MDRVKRNAAALKASFDQRVEDLCKNPRLKQGEIDCIKGPLVYLGEHYHSSKEISSQTMFYAVIDDAATWSTSKFKASPLAYYFKQKPNGIGYELKSDFACTVDHVISQQLSGLDHPTNYVFMSGRLNSSFNGGHYDEKFEKMGRHVQGKVCAMHRDNKKATAAATAAFLKSRVPPQGAIVIA
jgi:hypothetical protein